MNRYYIIEHPTRGTFAYWDDGPHFSWSGSRNDSAKAHQFKTQQVVLDMLNRLPERIRRNCYVLESPATYGGEWERIEQCDLLIGSSSDSLPPQPSESAVSSGAPSVHRPSLRDVSPRRKPESRNAQETGSGLSIVTHRELHHHISFKPSAGIVTLWINDKPVLQLSAAAAEDLSINLDSAHRQARFLARP